MNTLPKRTVMLKNHTEAFMVSKYICRSDIDDPGKIGTHGWQVKYQGKTKFFSDTKKHDRAKHCPRVSLLEAETYLSTIYCGPALRIRTKEQSNKVHSTGTPGIHVRKRYSYPDKATLVYILIKGFKGGCRDKYIHLGVDAAVSKELMERQLRRAVEIREEMLVAHRKQHYVPPQSNNETIHHGQHATA